jgi:hypothetical protein
MTPLPKITAEIVPNIADIADEARKLRILQRLILPAL